MPLNGVGRAQAEEVGRALGALDLSGCDFVASPLVRTRETMDLLRRSAGLPEAGYRVEPRFSELRFGDWEGSTWKELRRRVPGVYREREADRWRFRPPGGGESYADLCLRLGPAVAALGRTTVLVSHGGVARALMTTVGGARAEEALRASIWQGRVLLFEGGGWRWM